MSQVNFPARVAAPCLAIVCLLAGCKQAPELPAVISPYRIDIQQGNVVTQEMVSKLKAGMTRAQVRFVLGSPLVVDPFRTDRWDYVSIYQKQGKEIERRRVTAIFEDDKLVRVEGDVKPGEALPATDKPPVEKPAPPRPSVQQAVQPGNQPTESSPAAATAPPVESNTVDAAKPAADPKKDEAARKDDAAKKDAAKDKPKSPGFFGRMLDKLGL
jgi:outer membrane protein assembly factor BamE